MKPLLLITLLVTTVPAVWASSGPDQRAVRASSGPDQPALNSSEPGVLVSEKATSAAVSSAEWQAYKAAHGKAYSDAAEEARRLQAYAANKAFVARHNAEQTRGQHSFTVALNKFADLTAAEFAARYTSGGRRGGSSSDREESSAAVSVADLPTELDWRQRGVVTPVADQAGCTADWAFSAVGVLESARAVAGAPLEPLSAQQLIDCDVLNGVGCDGGGMVHYALHYTELVNGIEPNATYPYTGVLGKCHANQNNFINDMDYFIQLRAGYEEVLLDAVANMGPISASADGRYPSFQLYESGVYYEPECSSYHVNHPMLVVGYGTTEDGEDYWLVKNCWGAGWGEDGCIRMIRNKEDNCGLSSQAYYVAVDLSDGTET